MARPLRFILFGPPASGKGTQGHRLAGEFELKYLSTGGLLRQEMAEASDLGRKIHETLEQGKYVSDSIMIPLVSRWTSDLHQRGEGYVLDGFPRTVPQANELGDDVDLAIMLDVALPELERRVLGRLECEACHYVTTENEQAVGSPCPKCTGEMTRRHDDDRENFLSRHQQYQKHTEPLLTYYSDRGKLVRIDGLGAPHMVFARLINAVRKKMPQEATTSAASLV